jgi:hypothetical protein
VGSVVENSRLPGDYQETLGMTLGIAKRPLTWGFVCRKLPPSATATRADDREKRRVPSRKPARKPGLTHRSPVTNQKVADRFNGGGAPTEVVLGHAGVPPGLVGGSNDGFARRWNWPKQPDGKVGPKRWTG